MAYGKTQTHKTYTTMTNDIVKIKSVAASQGGETEHGLMLDSSILSYTYQGSSKTVKWILDTIFTLLGGKAETSTTYTKTEVDTALAGKKNANDVDGKISNAGQKVECKSNGNIEITATSVIGSAIADTSALLAEGGAKIPTAGVVRDALALKSQYLEVTYSGTKIDLTSYRNTGVRAFNILLHNQTANARLQTMFEGVLYSKVRGGDLRLQVGDFLVTLIIYTSSGYYYAVADAVGPLFISGD